MKIQCDVCSKESASVFCPSDEAALCDGCDRRVHHANKLAGKHTRFSLLHPSFQESPKCDICQDKRAFLFCQEDRAILCRECDVTIHRNNEHTHKHNRFLLTGHKLSAAAATATSSSSAPLENNRDGSDSNSNIIITSQEYLIETLAAQGEGGWELLDFHNYHNNGFCNSQQMMYDNDDALPFQAEDIGGRNNDHHYQNNFFHDP
ncbi:B-box zinc finger protein 21-like [Impatiens glandulifera]|uniref:B-box zinc finger protein 21-like n=1 Tax=Impatiens glandulifera TaxID=253017 RepID=UPI001FB190DA|nr:B-box zinc finger protein 21-like [Impatiens glandulifera]